MNKLDTIINDFRQQEAPEAVVREAGGRVRGKLFSQSAGLPERIRSCSDYQALIPAYLGRQLSAGRSLLLQDHTRECVACRHALERARAGAGPTLVRPRSMPSRTIPKYWAVAAMVLLTLGIGSFFGRQFFAPGAAGSISVQTVNGILYSVTSAGSMPIFPGREISEGEIVRTPKESTAVVRLADGSLVEMNERSELSVARSSRGATIRLNRGDIIVQAAKQRSGTLNVLTPDFLVSVKGTVFSVNRATKGTRVSVVEGAVNVQQGSQEQLLKPGGQAVSDPSLEQVPIQQTVAWSRDSAKYLALLGDFSTIQKGLQAAPSPALRYESKLFGYVGHNTVLYAAIPNFGSTLAEAQRLFEQRLRESPALQEWWKQQNEGGKLEEMLQKLRGFSDYLGDELVFTVEGDGGGRHTPPLILAEVKRPGVREFLQTEFRQLEIRGEKDLPQVIDLAVPANQANQFYRRERRTSTGSSDRMLIAVTDTILAIGWNQEQLDALGQRLAQGPSQIGDRGLLGNVQRAYAQGAGWLLAINMEHIARHAVLEQKKDENSPRLPPGLEAARYLMVERKDIGGNTENEATLSFEGRRSGVAAWLAEPAAMGTLDFVSPDATVAISMVLREPQWMLNDLLQYLRSMDAKIDEELDRIHGETGVHPVRDVGHALGGEATFALDGPLVPLPSWKLALEVYSPDRLQWAIERVIEAFNRDAKCEPCKLRLNKEQVSNRTLYTVSSDQVAYEIHYVFVDGYLVAAPSRTLLTRALQNRETGYVLARSDNFRAQLPRDGRSNFSAIIYSNAGSVVKPLAGAMGSLQALTPEERASIQALADNAGAGLIYAYGEAERIVVASRGFTLGLDLSTLALPQIIGRAVASPIAQSRTQ